MSGLHIVERVIRFTRWPIHYCHEMMTVTIAFQLSYLRIDTCIIVNGTSSILIPDWFNSPARMQLTKCFGAISRKSGISVQERSALDVQRG
jgi:hypothetical protein